MGRLATISDFLVDTNGHCFICLSKVSPKTQVSHDDFRNGQETPTLYSSLHSLSQYLKMDMSKVFHEKASIPSDLLDSVKRSKLKVSGLCEQCSKWNTRIAELYRQLEKIQTEANFYVELIHRSLSRRSNEDGLIIAKLGSKTNSDVDARLIENMRIVKALRTETIEKCSHNLRTNLVRVKVQNLNPNQTFLKKQKLKSKSRKNTDNPNKGNYSKSGIHGGDLDNDDGLIKTKSSDTDRNDDVNSEVMDQTISEDYDGGNYAEENDGDTRYLDLDDNLIDPAQSTSMRNVKNETNNENGDMTITKSSVQTLPSISSIKNIEKLTYPINPTTGKFKCNICSVESKRKDNLKQHYDSVHLKIKHKCNLCGKEFTRKSDYSRHHRIAHVGVRFKCNLCGQCFTEKKRIIEHQQCVHMGKRFQCQFCPKSFAKKCSVTSHVRASHRQ